MTEEWEQGAYWVSENADVIRINKICGTTVHFSFLKDFGCEYETSKKVFKVFYRRLEPEEEGLMLLSTLDK